MISIEKKPLHKQLDAFLGITIRFEYCRCFFFFFFVTLRRFVVRWRSPHRNSTQDLHQRAPYGSILKKKYKRKKKKKIFVVRQGGKEGEVKQKEKRNSKKKKKNVTKKRTLLIHLTKPKQKCVFFLFLSCLLVGLEMTNSSAFECLSCDLPFSLSFLSSDCWSPEESLLLFPTNFVTFERRPELSPVVFATRWDDTMSGA